jgi:hypothetical protein
MTTRTSKKNSVRSSPVCYIVGGYAFISVPKAHPRGRHLPSRLKNMSYALINVLLTLSTSEAVSVDTLFHQDTPNPDSMVESRAINYTAT